MPRTPHSPVTDLLRTLGLEADAGEALHAQVARALEASTRATKPKSAALAKARNLANQPPAATIEPLLLVPVILAVRDALKRGERGGRTSRARQERLDRAADAALRALAGAGASPKRAAGTRPRGSTADPEAARSVLERLVTLTPDAVITLRESGKLGRWSVAASRLTGRRRWEVHRRGAASIFQDKTLLDTVLAVLDARGRVADREAILVGRDGTDVPVRIYGARLKGPVGSEGARAADPERYLFLLQDRSEVHHIRRRLIETEKLSAMAKIAGSVAHEFRNPLNSLFLSTDLLEDELEGHDDVQESIAPTLLAIREEIERLNQIITHYLALSQVAGAHPEEVDLRDVVAAFASDSAERLAERDVDLRVNPDDGDCRITADPNQLRRILVNLVENAVDALTLPSDAEEEGRRPRRSSITLRLRRMRRSVKLTVKDNGPGIPEDIRERVFEPFFTSKAGGSGLGLYLVREIALASDGTMSLSSKPGRGTSVSIRWPYARTNDE